LATVVCSWLRSRLRIILITIILIIINIIICFWIFRSSEIIVNYSSIIWSSINILLYVGRLSSVGIFRLISIIILDSRAIWWPIRSISLSISSIWLNVWIWISRKCVFWTLYCFSIDTSYISRLYTFRTFIIYSF